MVSTKSDQHQKGGGFLTFCLVVASLYFAREVLVPIALAILLAFLLEPLAKVLERLHLGRSTAAVTAVVLGLVVAGTLAFFILGQFSKFGDEFPKYETQIHEKVRKLQSKGSGFFGHTMQSVQDFKKDLTPTNSLSSTNITQGKPTKETEVKAVPVEVRNPEASTLQVVRKVLGPSLNLVVTLFLVSVFAIFMLAGRDDWRARLLRIAGSHNGKMTRQLMDEIGERVSRYLLMQLVVNVGYGIPIGLGLWAIGIPNPLLWGMLSALFRYIPYAGPWIAASLPFAVGFAVGSDWSKPLMVLGLFLVMEILTANLVEPWLYGNSTGITPLAVLLAAVFWTWVWGPVGLLLSMPMTVCVISIARYVPQLELLDQLFGETKHETKHRAG